MTFPIEVRDSQLGASFSDRIRPQAAKTSITGTHAGALKLSVSAPPVEDRANEALVEFFAELFQAPSSAIQILSGAHSRYKVIRIAGRSASEIQLALREHFRV
jgi:uncharacterized protein